MPEDQIRPKAREMPGCVDRLRAADYATACAMLNGEGEDYNATVEDQFNVNSLHDGINYFRAAIGDRRLSRVFSLLKELPREEAALQASELFDEKLEIHGEAWKTGMLKLGRGERAGVAAVMEHPHALRCALFLVAHFCEKVVVIQKLNAWTRTLEPVGALVRIHPKSSLLLPQFLELALPDNLLLVNILVHSLKQSGKLSDEVLAEARRLGLPPLSKVPVKARNEGEGIYRNGITPFGRPPWWSRPCSNCTA